MSKYDGGEDARGFAALDLIHDPDHDTFVWLGHLVNVSIESAAERFLLNEGKLIEAVIRPRSYAPYAPYAQVSWMPPGSYYWHKADGCPIRKEAEEDDV